MMLINLKNIFIVSCVAIFLSACAAATVKELKSDPSKTMHVVIDDNYQRVYKNLLGKMRECMGEGYMAMSFADLHIREGLYSELREAEISYVMSNVGHQGHYLHVDIKAIGDNKTRLDAYVYFSTWKPALRRVEVWATNPRSTCYVKPVKTKRDFVTP